MATLNCVQNTQMQYLVINIYLKCQHWVMRIHFSQFFKSMEYRDHTCFLCINICHSRGSCFNTRPLGQVFKHRPRDHASVNAMKQTRLIVILAYFTWFQHKRRWKRCLNIKYSFSYTWFLKTKWRQRQTFNVITSPQRHIYACNVFANESIWEMIIHGRNTFQCTSGPSLVFSSKSHVQTAHESHDLNLDFAASNSSA